MHILIFDRFDRAELCWRLAERHCVGYPYQHYDWLSRWHEEVGAPRGVHPQIVMLQDEEGIPLMLLPLGIDRTQGIRVVRWLGDGVSDLQAPLVHPQYARRSGEERIDVTWGRIRASLAPHDAVHLSQQTDWIGSIPNPLASLGGMPQTVAYQATLAGDWQTFYESRVSKRGRKDSARRARRLAERGEIRFVVAEDEAEARRITEQMMEQKSRRFVSTGAPDLFASPEARRFYLRVATEGVRDGFAHVSALMCDDEIIATHWAVVAQGWMAALFSGYESGEWERLSPGQQLQDHVIAWCFDHGYDVYDFSIGDEAYKQAWSDREMHLHEYLEPATVAGRTYTLPRRSHRYVKRSAKQVGPLVRLVRSAKGHALGLKARRDMRARARSSQV